MEPRLDQNQAIRVAESGPPPPARSLAGPLCADIAIVVGGLTGVAAARHLVALRHPERGGVLLEARTLGHGAKPSEVPQAASAPSARGCSAAARTGGCSRRP